jgi:hypothetical protein
MKTKQARIEITIRDILDILVIGFLELNFKLIPELVYILIGRYVGKLKKY